MPVVKPRRAAAGAGSAAAEHHESAAAAASAAVDADDLPGGQWDLFTAEAAANSASSAHLTARLTAPRLNMAAVAEAREAAGGEDDFIGGLASPRGINLMTSPAGAAALRKVASMMPVAFLPRKASVFARPDAVPEAPSAVPGAALDNLAIDLSLLELAPPRSEEEWTPMPPPESEAPAQAPAEGEEDVAADGDGDGDGTGSHRHRHRRRHHHRSDGVTATAVVVSSEAESAAAEETAPGKEDLSSRNTGS